MSNFDIQNPKLTAKNSHFGNEYAPLEEVLATVTPFLRKNNLDIRQTVQLADAVSFFVTELISLEDGKVVKQVATPFVLQAQSPQAVGSAITYSRRYGLLLMFNLVGEADDDGEAAEGRGKKTTARKPKAKTAPKPAPKKAEPSADEDW